MTGGVGFLDYDDDGFLDVYLVQSGSFSEQAELADDGNRLFRNRGDGTFEDVTELAGVGDRGYGMGLAVGDYDHDGRVDIYVTNVGSNRLFRNLGEGRFVDVTAEAGVGDTGFSSSAAFLDYDGDGDLDLFVCNYSIWSVTSEKRCLGPSGQRSYCHPNEYEPQSDTLYRNAGDGTFADVSAESAIGAVAATGLGVAAADFDSDGLLDIYVANDQMANHLWINQGDGRFAEEALWRGAALNALGQAEAGMGVVAEDIDADGDWDLFMVHLSGETNTLYRNDRGYFRDATHELGLAVPGKPYTGFGTALFDYDNDGLLDVFIANGKVAPGDSLDNERREPNLLLRGRPSGRFEEVPSTGGALALLQVSRGAAFGDYDNDGDVDILVGNNAGPVRLLRNEVGSANHWLSVSLDGRPDFDRTAVGATVTVTAGGETRRWQVRPGAGYCSSQDPRVHVGLGETETVERLVVEWPDGRRSERTNVAADQFLEIPAPGAAR
jgi:hypothetical protein